MIHHQKLLPVLLNRTSNLPRILDQSRGFDHETTKFAEVKIKIFQGDPSKIEEAVNAWLAVNSRAEIVSLTQTALATERSHTSIGLTILYKEPPPSKPGESGFMTIRRSGRTEGN